MALLASAPSENVGQCRQELFLSGISVCQVPEELSLTRSRDEEPFTGKGKAHKPFVAPTKNISTPQASVPSQASMHP